MKTVKESHENGNPGLHLVINEKRYEWKEQYITGAEIRKLGNIAKEDEIYLQIKDPWKDELIPDEERVNLARPSIEYFFSKPLKVKIIVNGAPKDWVNEKITFKEVIILAYGTYNDSPTMVYTVGYEDGPRQNPEGTMNKESIVFVKNKMIFHATATDKS